MRIRLHGFRRTVGIVVGKDAQRACQRNLKAPTSRSRKVGGGKGASLILRLLHIARKIGGGW